MLNRFTAFLGCFFFLFLLPASLRADGGFISPDTDTSLKHLPDKILQDLPHLFIEENLIPFTVGSAATALDWAVWDGQNTLAANLNSWNTQPLFDFGNFYGEGWLEGGAALGSWSLGSLWKDEKLQQFGRDSVESLAVSAVLCFGIKLAVNRTRPEGGGLGFPSGHTITAFCVAPVVQKYWGWEAGVPAYALATVTGLARVEGYHHYLSDVIAGATLGIVIGNAVVYAPKDVSVSVGPGQWGLNLAFD